jgi:heme/copper-type cytochrome/quinol oxidase subunit 2
MDLAWLTLAIATAIFLVVEALLVASALRWWRAAPAGERARWRWELLWTLLPALGLLALGLLSGRALRG